MTGYPFRRWSTAATASGAVHVRHWIAASRSAFDDIGRLQAVLPENRRRDGPRPLPPAPSLALAPTRRAGALGLFTDQGLREDTASAATWPYAGWVAEERSARARLLGRDRHLAAARITGAKACRRGTERGTAEPGRATIRCFPLPSRAPQKRSSPTPRPATTRSRCRA